MSEFPKELHQENKTIVVAQFFAFAKFNSLTFFDKDAQQIEKEIRDICPTAHIVLIIEYPITSYKELRGYKKNP